MIAGAVFESLAVDPTNNPRGIKANKLRIDTIQKSRILLFSGIFKIVTATRSCTPIEIIILMKALVENAAINDVSLRGVTRNLRKIPFSPTGA